jgi:hypothetical protein
MSSIHFYAPNDKKIWSWLGLVFAIMYRAVLSANYWVLMGVVRESLLSGYTEGLAWFVVGSPHSITNTLEGIGYGFMGLATLFAGQAFDGGRLERCIRWLFIMNGVACIAGTAQGGLGIMAATMVSLECVVCCVPRRRCRGSCALQANPMIGWVTVQARKMLLGIQDRVGGVK